VFGSKYQVGTGLAGTTVTMRLDAHLMHAIADGALAGTWPCPITAERAARLSAATAVPPPSLPAGSIGSRTAGKNWPSSPAATPHPITRLYVRGKGTQPS